MSKNLNYNTNKTKAASFIIRISHPNGLKRLIFDSDGTTQAQFTSKIESEYSIPKDQQLLSRSTLNNPNFIEARPNQSLHNIGLKHGDMLYLVSTDSLATQSNQRDVEMKTTSSNQSESQSRFKLTSRCQHSEQGRCMHCLNSPSNIKSLSLKSETSEKNDHKTKSDEPLPSQMCNHSNTSFCIKCMPPASSSKSKLNENQDEVNGSKHYEKPLLCNCIKGQKCIHCVAAADANSIRIKIDILPFSQYLIEQRRKTCRHHFTKTCSMCEEQKIVSYKGNVDCPLPHRKWPHGVCSRCMPPNASLRSQEYRHCDGVSFTDLRAMEKFISIQQSDPSVQRACILFGRYVDDQTVHLTKNYGAIRAEVQAVYMPPQIPQANGVLLLEDPNETTVEKVAEACGLKAVGQAITTLPRGGDKYGGDMFMSGLEVRQAARFQWKYANKFGHSRFVTMVIQYNKEGQIEPLCYQVSDQCVALERDGLLQDAEDFGFLTYPKASKGQLIASIIYKNNALEPGQEFLPDEFLVKVVAMKPHNPIQLFKYVEFPFMDGSEADFKVHLNLTSNDSYHAKFSDFALLLWITQILDLKTTLKLARYVVKGQLVDDELRNELDSTLVKYF